MKRKQRRLATYRPDCRSYRWKDPAVRYQIQVLLYSSDRRRCRFIRKRCMCLCGGAFTRRASSQAIEGSPNGRPPQRVCSQRCVINGVTGSYLKILHSLKERKRQRVGQSNEASKWQRPERRWHVVIASFLSRGAPLYLISVWIFWKPICWKRGDGRRANHDGTLLLCRFYKSVTYQITAVSRCHFKTG